MPLTVGSRVGAYDVLGSLGVGGMGEVYRAHDPRLGRDVALKILPEPFASDPERIARFAREARALASLNHPNIAQIYGVEESGTTRALVLEMVAGDTLAERIERGRLPAGDALAIARQIAEALDAAHERGIVHRDLKPANVKLRPDGVVKVLDFGLAKMIAGDENEDESATRTATGTRAGAVVGTAAYMSPEQARGQPIDKRTDIWSFGCVLYEMLTGRRAFAAATGSDTLVAVLDRDPDWHAIPASTSPGVQHLVRRCLEKDPKRRLRDIGDAVSELSDHSDRGTASDAGRPSPRLRRAMWAAAAIAALTATSAVWLWTRRSAASTSTTVVPLTTYAGFESHPSLSPDGNQVAFTWNGERQDNLDVYVKVVGPGTPLRLTTDPASDTSPAWSPDGKWIAFLRLLANERAALNLVPALGGPARELGQLASSRFAAMPDFGHALSWFPDSQALVVAETPSPESQGGLFVWSVATGERHRLTTAPRNFIDYSPALSADGRQLAFVRFVGFGISDVYLLALGDDGRPLGEVERVTRENRFLTSTAWMPGSREVLFASGALTGGVGTLFTVDLDDRTRTVRRLAGVDANASLAATSRTSALGRARIVYSASHFDTGIWRLALPRGDEASAPSPPIPFIVSTRPDYQAQYSPDGRRVVFMSSSSGISEIWVGDDNGANLVQLTTAGWAETAAPRWSPDGSTIVFHARPEGSGDVYAIPARGGVPRRITDDPADDWGGCFSRDGQSIFFSSNRSGRLEIWKAPAAGGAASQVTRNGGMGPAVSPDGRHVYFTKGFALWRAPVEGGEELRVVASLSDWSRAAVTGDGIYYFPNREPAASASGYPIQYYRFADGQTRRIAQIDKAPFLGLSVSPDGRWMLFSQMDQSGTDLMVVETGVVSR
jgi:eukaryotic-like serine/threonine-protein kinase